MTPAPAGAILAAIDQGIAKDDLREARLQVLELGIDAGLPNAPLQLLKMMLRRADP